MRLISTPALGFKIPTYKYVQKKQTEEKQTNLASLWTAAGWPLAGFSTSTAQSTVLVAAGFSGPASAECPPLFELFSRFADVLVVLKINC